jgi:hypothetical protein
MRWTLSPALFVCTITGRFAAVNGSVHRRTAAAPVTNFFIIGCSIRR